MNHENTVKINIQIRAKSSLHVLSEDSIIRLSQRIRWSNFDHIVILDWPAWVYFYINFKFHETLYNSCHLTFMYYAFIHSNFLDPLAPQALTSCKVMCNNLIFSINERLFIYFKSHGFSSSLCKVPLSKLQCNYFGCPMFVPLQANARAWEPLKVSNFKKVWTRKWNLQDDVNKALPKNKPTIWASMNTWIGQENKHWGD